MEIIGFYSFLYFAHSCLHSDCWLCCEKPMSLDLVYGLMSCSQLFPAILRVFDGVGVYQRNRFGRDIDQGPNLADLELDFDTSIRNSMDCLQPGVKKDQTQKGREAHAPRPF